MKSLACMILLGLPMAAIAQTTPGQNPVQQPPGKNPVQQSPISLVTVTLSPPQYVYYCTDPSYLGSIVMAPTLIEGREWFEILRLPEEGGIYRCDYLIDMETRQYVTITQLSNLRQTPIRFGGPTAAPLPDYGYVFQGNDGTRDYYVYLAFPNIGAEVQSWAYDYMVVNFGLQP